MKNNKLILKKQQRFKSERHNVFTEEIDKVDLSSNDVKRMQLTASIETYAFGASKDLISEREEIKYNNIKKTQKMINFDHTTTENTKEQNKNWSQILDTLCRILIIGGFGSRKINSMFNLISQQPDIDKIYLYAKDPCEAKSPFLINK